MGWHNVARVERMHSDMAVIWWFAGTLLMLLSFVLWLSTLAGREGVLRIGKVTVAQSREGPKPDVRLVRLSNAILGLVGILVGLTIILVVVF